MRCLKEEAFGGSDTMAMLDSRFNPAIYNLMAGSKVPSDIVLGFINEKTATPIMLKKAITFGYDEKVIDKIIQNMNYNNLLLKLAVEEKNLSCVKYFLPKATEFSNLIFIAYTSKCSDEIKDILFSGDVVEEAEVEHCLIQLLRHGMFDYIRDMYKRGLCGGEKFLDRIINQEPIYSNVFFGEDGLDEQPEQAELDDFTISKTIENIKDTTKYISKLNKIPNLENHIDLIVSKAKSARDVHINCTGLNEKILSKITDIATTFTGDITNYSEELILKIIPKIKHTITLNTLCRVTEKIADCLITNHLNKINMSVLLMCFDKLKFSEDDLCKYIHLVHRDNHAYFGKFIPESLTSLKYAIDYNLLCVITDNYTEEMFEYFIKNANLSSILLVDIMDERLISHILKHDPSRVHARHLPLFIKYTEFNSELFKKMVNKDMKQETLVELIKRYPSETDFLLYALNKYGGSMHKILKLAVENKVDDSVICSIVNKTRNFVDEIGDVEITGVLHEIVLEKLRKK